MAIENDSEILVPLGFVEAEGSKQAQKDFDEGSDNVTRGFSKMKVAAIQVAAALAAVYTGVKKANQIAESSLALENTSRIIGETTEELREWEHLGAQNGIKDMIGQVSQLSNMFGKLKLELETGNGSEQFSKMISDFAKQGIDVSRFEGYIREGDEMGFIKDLQSQVQSLGLEGQDIKNVLDVAGLGGMFNLFDQPFEKFVEQLNRARNAVDGFANQADASNSELAKSMDVLAANIENLTSEVFAPFGEFLREKFIDPFNKEIESDFAGTKDMVDYTVDNPLAPAEFVAEKFEEGFTAVLDAAGLLPEGGKPIDITSQWVDDARATRAQNEELQYNYQQEQKMLNNGLGYIPASQTGGNPESINTSSPPIIVQNLEINSTASDTKKLAEEIQRDPTLHNYNTQQKF